MGNVALSVNDPGIKPPSGWEWLPLARISRMESGHTPSREKTEYWGGDIPWIGIRDAKRAHGGTLSQTLEYTNDLGIANSSARILPAGTICLSRTASVGYVVKMGRDMATSQDFANWVCSDRIEPDFLRYLFLAEESALSRFSSGSVHQTIYYPELKAFHVCVPSVDEQKRIVAKLDQAFAALNRARANAEANLADAKTVFNSHVDSVFSGREATWNTKPLGDLADFRNGINFTKSSRGWEVRLLGVKDFQNHFHAPDTELDHIMIDSEFDAADSLRRGDIVFVRSNGNPELIGRSLVVEKMSESTVHSGFTIRARLRNDSVLPDYLGHAVKSSAARRKLVDGGIGTNIKSLNQGTLSQLLVSYPDRDEQARIVEHLQAVREEIERLESICVEKLADIAILRQSLLQAAFSGHLS